MTEISQGALHSVVAPRGVSQSHTHNELRDLLGNRRPAGSLARIGPLASNEIAIPGEERIWGHQIGDFVEHLPIERLCFGAQASPIVIGEMQPTPLELLLEDAILLHEIVDDALLVPIDPAGKDRREERE